MSFVVANVKIVLASHKARLPYWCTVYRLEVSGSSPSLHTILYKGVYVIGGFVKHNPNVRMNVNKSTFLHVNWRHGGRPWYVGVQHNESAFTRKQKPYNRVTNLAVVRACPVKQQNLFSYNATILRGTESFFCPCIVSLIRWGREKGVQVHWNVSAPAPGRCWQV